MGRAYEERGRNNASVFWGGGGMRCLRLSSLLLDIGVNVAWYVLGGGVVSTVGSMVHAGGTVVRDCAAFARFAFRTPSCSTIN